MNKIVQSNGNGNSEQEYQPGKTYEHIETDLWVEEDLASGETKFTYELLEEFKSEDDTESEN